MQAMESQLTVIKALPLCMATGAGVGSYFGMIKRVVLQIDNNFYRFSPALFLAAL